MVPLFFAAAFMTGGAFAQEYAEARVPVYVNADGGADMDVAVTIEPASGAAGVSAEKTVTTNKWDTLTIRLSGLTSVSREPRDRANVPAAIRYANGNITVDLHSRQFLGGAAISLYSVNGKRVLNHGLSVGDGGADNSKISRSNVAPGVYLLSVKGMGGNSFTRRLTHSGGRLSVAVNSRSFDKRSLLNRSAGSGYGTWAIRAAADGFQEHFSEFEPFEGVNDPQIITMYAQAAGFEPEMLGLFPGADISEIRFAWYSDSTDVSGGQRPSVRVYGENGALVSTAEGVSGRASAGKRFNKVTVKNLAPDTRYRYSVSSDGTDWSREYGYKTPGAGAFRFAGVGDPQIDLADGVSASETWKNTVAKIASRGVDFILSAGDQVENYSGDENEYRDFFAPPELRSVPLAPVMGNHDMNNMFYYHFNLPNANSSASRWYNMFYYDYSNYWYLYNNVLFVGLNTGLALDVWEELTNPLKETAMFDSLIAAAKGASKGKYVWLVIHHHRSTRSVGPHSIEDANDRSLRLYREAGFEDVMDKHGVDLVIAGHDHIYVRSHPLKNGQIAADGEGTTYLTLTSSASIKFYPVMTPAESWVAKTYPARNAFNPDYKHGYALFDVDGNTISATIYDVEGGVLDSFEMSK